MHGFDASKLNQNLLAVCQNCGYKASLNNILNHKCSDIKNKKTEELKEKKEKKQKELINQEQPYIKRLTIYFPNEKLIRNNELLRSHWSRRAAEKKKWIKLLQQFSNIWGLPSEKVRIEYTRCIGKKCREMDKVNLTHGFKQIEDAIRDLNMIIDDKPQNLESNYIQIKSDKNGIIIDMERL